MNTIKNLQKINLPKQIKEKAFRHAVFIKEEMTADKLSFHFVLTPDHIPLSIDITLKDKHTLQFMSGTNNSTQFEQLDGKIEDVLEWFYHQLCNHPLFRLRIVTNEIRFKFVKVNGNVLYHHYLSFMEK